MASGYPSGGGGGGGGGDFYNTNTSNGGGSINNVQLHYRSQLAKRSIAESERQHHHQAFLRSVKQRSNNNNNSYYQTTTTSPISPQTPFEFSTMDPSSRYAQTQTHPLYQQLRNNSYSLNNIINHNNNNNNVSNQNPTFCYSQLVPKHGVFIESKVDPDKKLRNQLQELEKQLLDDTDEDGSNHDDVLSVFSNSEWCENLLVTPTQPQNQKQTPFSPSETSSSSSSSTSVASPSISSTKQSLIDIATAISEGNTETATVTLKTLKQFSNTRGDPQQRLTAYMVSALRSRINPVENPPPVNQLWSKDHIVGTQMLFKASPCFKLGFMAANLAILEATRETPNNIHVLDFEIGQGSQYSTLIHALGERQSGRPTFLKITPVIIDDSGNRDDLVRVDEWLQKIAARAGVTLKFNVVCAKLSELNRDSLCCDPDEALVVNFAFKLYKLADESVSTENPRDELLRLVKGLNPRVVTLVEQEMNCNTASFVARVAESSSYYLALLESLDLLDLIMNRDGVARMRIDECLGRKAANSVACEGKERLERCEVYGKWRARMGMAGLTPTPLNQNIADSLRARLSSEYGNNLGFTVKEDGGRISFGWMGRVLTVASAWC
ncbi:hypothetical protein GIB67_037261 [Kingdonia uniflora]|uniref:Scarecrow-like protein 8 n=1 Tax=Kingdonia uniflora TaxID=39325 RepID=A0A7J7MSL7_9MAGN|nr:hypothetical protein GIB67_037261 [Kingdonia uniflora]